MNEAMQKLVDAVEKASPIVWHAAYRQVWVELAEMVLWFLALLLLGRMLLVWRRSLMSKNEDGYRKSDADDPGPVFCVIGAVVSFIVCGLVITYAFDCAFNPTFQAIRQLKGLL